MLSQILIENPSEEKAGGRNGGHNWYSLVFQIQLPRICKTMPTVSKLPILYIKMSTVFCDIWNNYLPK